MQEVSTNSRNFTSDLAELAKRLEITATFADALCSPPQNAPADSD
jgi:hypothetical protein